MNIVADASPLISLAILENLALLPKLFEQILIPRAVFDEATTEGKPHSETIRIFAKDRVVSVNNELAVQLLLNDIHLGEAEAIVLAFEKGVPNILIDDAKGRRFVKLNGLHPIGTIGVLLQAKNTGLVKEVKPLLDKLIANKIRISDQLYVQALQLAHET
ncbi:MAG: DUF3368 domain-containing protein [Chloroflexi bacterium]|nr:MAG: DUF3368 domain-containing protein [Chloroflexota bacterium]